MNLKNTAKIFIDIIRKEKEIPYLAVETDYSTSDEGQLNTRIAAFIEML